MFNMNTTKQKRHGKDIFFSGEYIQYFKPDEKQNPFSKIYNRKKQDTIRIINELEHIKTILDVGGGMGRLSFALAESGQNLVVLTDISVDMLKLARGQTRGLNNLTLINADAVQLPYQDSSFDLVVGLDLFCHLEI